MVAVFDFLEAAAAPQFDYAVATAAKKSMDSLCSSPRGFDSVFDFSVREFDFFLIFLGAAGTEGTLAFGVAFGHAATRRPRGYAGLRGHSGMRPGLVLAVRRPR